MQSSATYAHVLKYSPTQPRGHKGTPVGGQFVSMDWGGGTSTEVLPSHLRLAEVDIGKSMLTTQAEKVAGPELIAELRDAGRIPFYMQYEVRGAVKRDIVFNLAGRLEKHPAFEGQSIEQIVAFVQQKVDLWAATSGDSSPEAIEMQQAVQAEFGLEAAPVGHLPLKKHAPPRNPIYEARDRAFVRAEYERTQEFLKAKGLTHVSVFRGTGNSAGLELGITTATMQPASSWTTVMSTAMSFATDGKDESVLLTARVPIEDVLSTSVTGRGALPEEEIILLGKPTRMRVYSVIEPEMEGDTRQITNRTEAVKKKIKADMR